MRGGREHPLSEAIGRLVEEIAPQTPEARIESVWVSVVGPAMAKATRPAGLRGGVLTVRCDASVYAQELQLLSPRVIEALDSKLGDSGISSLRCIVGSESAK
jgi:predicted nucleic acid-binding Zn ribbon protein